MKGEALTPADFEPFFAAVHGVAPFPWQRRLLLRLADGDHWPDILDLPTGSGKTAALDIAVFHLALEAARGPARRAALRIAFVVDRRLIVDDALGRAQRLERALRISTEPVLQRVASALRQLSGSDQPPLLARRLRGGAPREDDWARTPVQPTILCSTIDQVGSRLLFRGYGISDRMKPVHAGLLGSDCLLLLDEAHLAEPFHQTLRAIGDRHCGPDDAPWEVAVLTATPGQQRVPGHRHFELDDDDRRHPILARRLGAAKPARLPPPIAGEDAEPIVKETLKLIETLRSTLPSPAVGVILNRVARARQVFELLAHRSGDRAAIMLLIGPARAAERERLAIEQLAPIRTGAARNLMQPLIVVATQTIEAGIDIDFDGLVTEAAPLDALRQRFGRLNRDGRSIPAAAVVLARRDEIGPHADDPVYGDRVRTTWEALNQAAAGQGGTIDFGTAAFPAGLAEQAGQLVSLKPGAPILMPAYVDLWSQTSPIPNADPDVALFLHGPDRRPASVQIVWRADIFERDLTGRGGDSKILDILRLVPPRVAEAIEVPLWAARAWLRRAMAPLSGLADVAERPQGDGGTDRGRPAFCFAGADGDRSRIVWPNKLSDGDLVVVPAGYGGCDRWGWHPGSENPVRDLADAAAWPYRARRWAMRITPELLYQELHYEPDPGGDARWPEIDTLRIKLQAVLAEHRDDDPIDLLDAVAGIDCIPPSLSDRFELLRRQRDRSLQRHFAYGRDDEDRPEGVIFVARLGLRGVDDPEDREIAAPASTEDDDLGATPGYDQTLAAHSKDVRDYASVFAVRAGLAPPLAEDVALAAYLHDVGKADPRFQAYLAGGDPWQWDRLSILAKSRRHLPSDAGVRAGLPRHWRHEALSVRLAIAHPKFQEAHDPALVLWLIGVHHGLGRPLFPHCDPEDNRSRDDLPEVLGTVLSLPPGAGPQSLAFAFAGFDWPQTFEVLKSRYGVWGLARLEAFVRLADHRASEAGGRDPKAEQAAT